jgi:peptide/nickel transport system substrate-binding protein
VSQYAQAREIKGWRTIVSPSGYRSYLAFNLRTPALADVRVRRAICDSIDLIRLRESVLHGLGMLGVAHLAPTSFYYDRDLHLCATRVVEANRLLDEAGWKRTSSTGLRSKDGRLLRLGVAFNSGSAPAEQTVVLLQAAWRSVGIDCDLHRYAANLYFGLRDQGGILTSGRFDVALVGVGSGTDPSGTAFVTPGGFGNHGGYDNVEVNRLEAQGVKTYNRSERKAIYRQVQQIVAHDIPFITLWWRPDIVTFDERLHGVESTSPDSGIFWNVNDWSW